MEYKSKAFLYMECKDECPFFLSSCSHEVQFFGSLQPRKFVFFAFQAIPCYNHTLAIWCYVKFARFPSRNIEQMPRKFARVAFKKGLPVQSSPLRGFQCQVTFFTLVASEKLN